MSRIKDNVDLKELEKYGYMKWNNEKALVCYFKFIPTNAMIIQIDTKRIIDFQLPIQSKIKKEDVKLETFIQDLIKADLVEKVEG